jgi:hypothetical protein
MIVLLIALAIVAYLAKDALMKYGLLSPGETTVTSGSTAGERARSPAAGAVERTDAGTATPAPLNALERARSLESTLKQEAEKRAPD